MNLYKDTIAAISTPLGEGGIGIVRLSGKDALKIAERVFVSPKGKKVSSLQTCTMTYGYITDPGSTIADCRLQIADFSKSKIKNQKSKIIDEVLLSVMRAPHSYTKEDVVEINCHGGFLPLRKVLEIVLQEGARLAEPGEFTLRAFLNGRIDLVQAEAVADLISAKTEESGRIAAEQLSGGLSQRISSIQESLTEVTAHLEAYIDFPEDEIEPHTFEEIIKRLTDLSNELQRLSETYENGRFFREGVAIAIVGKPNVGKSSLLNAFLERDRAIVTDIPGTTRDTIEEYMNIQGFPVRIMDTAGIREVHHLAEKEGVNRSLQAIHGADIVLSVFDGSRPLSSEDREIISKLSERKAIFLVNKIDLPIVITEEDLPLNDHIPVVMISANTKNGLDTLKESIINHLLTGSTDDTKEGLIITNLRHKKAIDGSHEAIKRAMISLERAQPLEIVAIDLRDALDRLGEIVGTVTTDDILHRIFSNFCIGK